MKLSKQIASSKQVGWLVLLAGATPLLVAWPMPLQDWPNHMAGAHVLSGLLSADPFWTRFYRFNTFLVPNAAVDLGLLALHTAGCSEPVAAQLFLVATYTVFTGGLALLSRALATCGSMRIAAAVLLFYGVALFWGLINYVLAVGLMWGLLAIWIGAARQPGWRLVIAGLGAGLLLFVHAIPAVVFALLLACFDAARWRDGAGLRSCGSAPLALAVVAGLLRLLPGQTGHDLAAGYAGNGSFAAFTRWKMLVFATSQLGGSRAQDGATVLAWLGGLAAIGLAARPRMATEPALGVAVLVLLTLAAPERLGTGSLLDVRLAVLPPMLAAASLRLEWRSVAARQRCAALVALLVIGRTAVIATEAWRSATVFAAFDLAAGKLPQGSIMMMGYGRPLATLTWTDVWSPPIQSIAAQVVVRGIFFPALFANPDQQPIALRPEFQVLTQPWDFSDAAHRRQSLTALAVVCASGRYAQVFVTILYGDAPFRIVDACSKDAAD